MSDGALRCHHLKVDKPVLNHLDLLGLISFDALPRYSDLPHCRSCLHLLWIIFSSFLLFPELMGKASQSRPALHLQLALPYQNNNY